jgi:hypothetical protein
MIRRLPVGIALFGFGALQHFLCWRLYVRLAYSGDPAPSRAFADNSPTNLAISVLGGIAICLLILRFLKQSVKYEEVEPLKVMFRAGRYGVAATFFAFEGFCVLASIYLAIVPPSPVDIPVIPRIAVGFVAWLIEFESFGAFPMAAFLPVSFLLWFFAGIVIPRVPKQRIA